MTTRERIESALWHLNTYVKPGADDPYSVAYIADQLTKAITELTYRHAADTRRLERLAGAVTCPECGQTADDLMPTVQGRMCPACFDLFADVADLDDDEGIRA